MKKETSSFAQLERELAYLKELPVLPDFSSHEAEYRSRVDAFSRALHKAELKALMGGQFDKNDAIISIYSGAGGRDAQDFASMLLRMYQRFSEREGFSIVVAHHHVGEEGGTKNVSMEIEGRYAYGYLKNESGVHRLVRVSPFSAQKLRHTSFALVEVLPVIETAEHINVNPTDLRIETFRSSGPGGQNVNKRETAVRITHIPTGLYAASQVSRTQSANKELAMKFLYAKLGGLMRQQKVETLDRLKVEQREPEWGSQIRSYVLHPYKMVKDHRTNYEVTDVADVLDGNLSEFIWKELMRVQS